MVVTIFTSRVREEHADEYGKLAGEMFQIARTMPGFVSIRAYASDDGENASVIEFDSAEHLRAWREHPQHLEAQRLGREKFYAEYRLQICEEVRSSAFTRDETEA